MATGSPTALITAMSSQNGMDVLNAVLAAVSGAVETARSVRGAERRVRVFLSTSPTEVAAAVNLPFSATNWRDIEHEVGRVVTKVLLRYPDGLSTPISNPGIVKEGDDLVVFLH